MFLLDFWLEYITDVYMNKYTTGKINSVEGDKDV